MNLTFGAALSATTFLALAPATALAADDVLVCLRLQTGDLRCGMFAQQLGTALGLVEARAESTARH